jgi:hypothetical protein
VLLGVQQRHAPLSDFADFCSRAALQCEVLYFDAPSKVSIIELRQS